MSLVHTLAFLHSFTAKGSLFSPDLFWFTAKCSLFSPDLSRSVVLLTYKVMVSILEDRIGDKELGHELVLLCFEILLVSMEICWSSSSFMEFSKTVKYSHVFRYLKANNKILGQVFGSLIKATKIIIWQDGWLLMLCSAPLSLYVFNWFMAVVKRCYSELCGANGKEALNVILFVGSTSWCFVASALVAGSLVLKSVLVGASFTDIRTPKVISNSEGMISLLNSKEVSNIKFLSVMFASIGFFSVFRLANM